MAFTIPGPSEFKSQFPRDFPYAVPSYGASGLATLSGDGVGSISVVTGGAYYSSAPTVLLTGPNAGGTQATATASISQGKVNGFTVTNAGSNYTVAPSVTLVSTDGDNTNQSKVTDDDILGAAIDAQFNINQGLFSTQAFFTRAFLFVCAHYLVEKILAATQGLASQYNWITTQKTVGEISAAYGIPDRILKDPMLGFLGRTRYGATYLAIISPQLVANIGISHRQTLP